MFLQFRNRGYIALLVHCHNFNHIPIDHMNSVTSVYDNFVSLSGKDKKDILLFGDSRLD